MELGKIKALCIMNSLVTGPFQPVINVNSQLTLEDKPKEKMEKRDETGDDFLNALNNDPLSFYLAAQKDLNSFETNQ